MKKTFHLTHPKLPLPRLVESIKHEVKKYIKRSRRRELPPKADFWDFDCRFGVDEASSKVIHVSAINSHISKAESKELKSFFLEVLAKPGYRSRTAERAAASDNADGVDTPDSKDLADIDAVDND